MGWLQRKYPEYFGIVVDTSSREDKEGDRIMSNIIDVKKCI